MMKRSTEDDDEAEDDLEDFLKKVDTISSQIQAIKRGEADEDLLRLPSTPTSSTASTKTTNDSLEFERRRQEALDRLEQEKAEGARKRRDEEKKKWWEHAKLVHGGESKTEGDDDDAEERRRLKAAEEWRRSHDANDYSRWDRWLTDLDDPIAREQKLKLKEKQNAKDMSEFEARNAEWCAQMRKDMDKRRDAAEAKEKRCARLRKEGNEHYKRKRFQRAVLFYHECLKLCPFDVAVLTNIAQCQWKLRDVEQTIEFASRALFVEPNHVKALCRRAAALSASEQFDRAVEDLDRASVAAPDNASVTAQRLRLRRAIEDASIADDDAVEDTTIASFATAIREARDDRILAIAPAVRATLRRDPREQIRLRKLGVVAALLKRALEKETLVEETLLTLRAMSANAVNRAEFRRRRTPLVLIARAIRDNHGGIPAVNAAVALLETVTTADPEWRRAVARDEALVSKLENARLLRSLSSEPSAPARTLVRGTIRTLLSASKRADDQTACCEALANLTRRPDARPLLIEFDAVDELLRIACRRESDDATRAAACAAIANAAIGHPETCAAIGVEGAIGILSAVLRARSNEMSKRLATLLARCVQGDPSTLERLCDRKIFDDVVAAFLREEKLVSVVAACLKRSASLAVRAREALPSLIRLLPVDAKEIKQADPVTYGNATQCIIACAERFGNAEDVAVWTRCGIVERLIEILKSSENESARRNAAIALAKLSRTAPSLLPRIRELRGIEIMMSVLK